jgi:formamidopyrimidine-DNA glycosylase
MPLNRDQEGGHMLTATPTKLRDGSWGARVKGAVNAGDVVTIKTSTGKTWDAKVEAVLWSGDGVSLCKTSSLDRAPAPSSGSRFTRRTGGCRGCGGPIRHAKHHRAMEGYCGSCAFNEFDC